MSEYNKVEDKLSTSTRYRMEIKNTYAKVQELRIFHYTDAVHANY